MEINGLRLRTFESTVPRDNQENYSSSSRTFIGNRIKILPFANYVYAYVKK